VEEKEGTRDEAIASSHKAFSVLSFSSLVTGHCQPPVFAGQRPGDSLYSKLAVDLKVMIESMRE
jgi:hypothetical protein